MKYASTFAAGVLVILQGVWAFAVPAEQAAWLRWRVGAIIIAVLAVVALALQLRAMAKEEKKARARQAKQEKREHKRDKKIEELLRRMPPRGRAGDSAIPVLSEPSLEIRVESLAHKFYSFLGEKPSLATYDSKLKPELLALLPELQRSHLKRDISEIEVEPEQDEWIASVRNTADTLALAAVKLAYPKTKVSGSFLVLDED
jgi:membrane protein implicated in regulation of membrane protease activity